MRDRVLWLTVVSLALVGCTEPKQGTQGVDADTGGEDVDSGLGGGGPQVEAGISSLPTDGPPGGRDAVDGPVASDAPGDGATCPAGEHLCNGKCVSRTDPATCGDSCNPCMVPANGKATCDGTKCDFTCTTGTKCGSQCVTGCCSSADCAPMGGKTGQCDSSTHQCSYACGANTVPCGATCIATGACCTDADCAGNMACASSTCSTTTCRAGYLRCNGACVPPSSATTEVCDGKDNDCDGMTDEGLVETCSNRCTSGSKRCVNGSWDTSGCPPATVQCCNNSECGACQECVAGACANQAAGQDKKGECDGSNPTACRTGDCDGSGACQKRTGNSCDGADLIVCNASGTGTRQSCPSGSCSNSMCTSCGASGQPCCGASCNSGLMCSGGTCVTACVPNTPCGTNNMCTSSKISCATGSPVCVATAINEGIACGSKKCASGNTEVVEPRCSGGSCTDQTVQSCGGTKTCVSAQCKLKNGQSCNSHSECANNACNGPSFCWEGSNGHCPCTSDDDCESSDCRMNDSMKTCGGSLECPPGWSCNGTPPEQDTCNIFN